MVTVRLNVLNGGWETVGAGRYRGIVPEGFQATGDDKGPDTCTFSLKRIRGGGNFPDLSSYTPCEVERDGAVRWDGRVKETPARDGDDMSITVTGEGMNHFLDDDVYSKLFVHSRANDWVDRRSTPSAPIGSGALCQAAQVTVNSGTIVIGFPDGTVTVNGDAGYAVYDAGPNNVITRVIWKYQSSNNNNAAGQALAIGIAYDAEDVGQVTFWGPFALTTIGAGPTTARATLSPGKRYVAFGMIFGGTTANPDAWIRLNSVQLFTNTAWESGDTSILHVTDVFKDALTIVPQISTDLSNVQTSTFAIPDFGTQDFRSPREQIEAANAFEGWQYKIDVGSLPVLRPFPTTPFAVIGNWPGATFEDTSLNDGSEIYNKAISEYTDQNGVSTSVTRYTSQSDTSTTVAVASPAPDNPSFAVDASSWSASFGTIARTTTAGEFDSSPAGGKITVAGGAQGFVGFTVTETFTGTFLAGTLYTLSLRFRANIAIQDGQVHFQFGGASDYVLVNPTTLSTFSTVLLSWRPKTTQTSVTLKVFASDLDINVSTCFIDTLSLSIAAPTLLDRRGITRAKILQINAALTSSAANQVSDVFLGQHKTTPLKGTLTVTRGGLRRMPGGQAVAPVELLRRGGEVIRFMNLIHPDTGGVGRDGRIMAVSYDEVSDTATVTIDNERRNFDALLERLAVLAPPS